MKQCAMVVSTIPSREIPAPESQYFQKISVLQHAPSTHLPNRPGDPTPTSRNLDPLMHPFSRARERTRALNAAKLERIFAKPFIGGWRSLDGPDEVEVARWSGGVEVARWSGSGGGR